MVFEELRTVTRGRQRRLLIALAVMALGTAAACGGDDSDNTATPTSTADESAQHEGPINPCAADAPPDATALEGEAASSTATIIEVTAVDHEFQGVDATYPEGDYGFQMTNRGREAHEMAVIRIRDGETRPVEELLELSDEESEEVMEYIGGTVACPGETAESLGVAMTVGRYVMLCYIPTGLTSDVPSSEEAYEELGPPHFSQGMVTEIRVVES